MKPEPVTATPSTATRIECAIAIPVLSVPAHRAGATRTDLAAV